MQDLSTCHVPLQISKMDFWCGCLYLQVKEYNGGILPFDRSELDSLGAGESWLTGIFIDLVLYKVIFSGFCHFFPNGDSVHFWVFSSLPKGTRTSTSCQQSLWLCSFVQRRCT